MILSRNANRRFPFGRSVEWDGISLGPWAKELEGAMALINLAGVSVDCRYHTRNCERLLNSRVQTTRVLGQAVAQCASPPLTWLNSSTATIYKHTLGPAWDESGAIGPTPEAKDAFSVHVAKEWERSFNEANTPHTRKLSLRTAMVLGHGNNSVFPVLMRLAKLGLAGPQAGGHQYVSWIHIDDFCNALEWILNRGNLTGPVNVAAPFAVTNAECMTVFRKAANAPWGLPSPRWLLEIGAFFLRTETELLIKSRRIVPAKLLADGFKFRHPRLPDAVQNLNMKTKL